MLMFMLRLIAGARTRRARGEEEGGGACALKERRVKEEKINLFEVSGMFSLLSARITLLFWIKWEHGAT